MTKWANLKPPADDRGGRAGAPSGPSSGRLTFDEWLRLKNRQAVQRRRQQRRAAQQRREAQQLRRQLCDQSYADWLLAKRQPPVPKDSRPAEPQPLEAKSSQRLQLWHSRKQHEQQLERERRLFDARCQDVRDQLRRQLSQVAWQRWLARKEQASPSLHSANADYVPAKPQRQPSVPWHSLAWPGPAPGLQSIK